MSTSHPKTLRDIALIAKDKHDGASGYEMQRIAERDGYRITFTTFNKIVAGTYVSRATRKTLEALAHLSGIPIDHVYEVAGQRHVTDRFADQLPPDVDLLTEDQRNAVITVTRAFLKANRELEGLRSEPEQQDPNAYSDRHLHAVEDADGQDVGEEQKIERAAHTNYDPEIGPEDTPNEV